MNHLPEFWTLANALPIIGLLCSGAVLGFVACALLTRMDEATAYNRGYADAWDEVKEQISEMAEKEVNRQMPLAAAAERSPGA